MRRWTLLWVVLGVAASPVAGADSVDELFALDVDADEVVVRLQVTLTGEDAQGMRREIDEKGNNDGTVAAEEISRFNAEGTQKFAKDTPQCFETFELALIDDRTPQRNSLVSGRVEGGAGSVLSTTPLRVVATFTLLYDTPSASAHRVQIEWDEVDSFGDSMDCVFDTWAGDDDWLIWGRSPRSEGEGTGARAGHSVAAVAAVNAALPSRGLPSARLPQQASQTSGEDFPGTLLIDPRLGYSFDLESIKPVRVQSLWDGTGLRADSPTEQKIFLDELVTFTVHPGTSRTLGGTVRDVGAFVGFGFLGTSLLVLVAGLATEYGRFHLWKVLFLIPGFTRLEKDEVLEHAKRDELYRFIKQNPGPSFSDLRRELALSNGTLVHHLRILEAQEYLKGVRDGFRTRFYVRGPKIVLESYLTRTQIQLVEAIGANPGLTQKELAQVLGLPRESISYHAKQLAAKGRLSIRQEGKWRRYWPSSPSPRISTVAQP